MAKMGASLSHCAGAIDPVPAEERVQQQDSGGTAGVALVAGLRGGAAWRRRLPRASGVSPAGRALTPSKLAASGRLVLASALCVGRGHRCG